MWTKVLADAEIFFATAGSSDHVFTGHAEGMTIPAYLPLRLCGTPEHRPRYFPWRAAEDSLTSKEWEDT